MKANLQQFLEGLEVAGLLAESRLNSLRRQVEQNPNLDVKSVARALMNHHLLTEFQAQKIYQGKARSLVLGDYRLQDHLGQGATGAVFKAVQCRSGETVALKVLHPRLAEDPVLVQRFQREVAATRHLSHPHVIRGLELLQLKNAVVIVMEYLRGRDLESLVKDQGPLKIAEAVNVTLQAARGLHYLHRQQIIHRDIKPANLFRSEQGLVKVMDLGLARIADEGESAEQRLTRTGTIMGTVEYMSPEQGIDSSGCTVQSDIYSLGCTLHFLLLGRPVYEGRNLLEKLLAHRLEPIPDIQRDRPKISDDLANLFDQMVAKEPGDRLASMAEVIGALESLPG